MATKNFTAFTLPMNYINVLLGMSDDTKLRVIRILTDSMLNSKKMEIGGDLTLSMLKKYAGAWVGDESADDIVACIRENSSMREPLEF